jgi:CheY-like chemotaxis protein
MDDLSTWNVLVVDDEPDNMGVVELVLGYHNASVQTATSGAQCLEMLEKQMPSLLLIDIQMPGMSGFELLKKIRADRRWQHIPTVAVTAHAMAGDMERILAAGFDGYVPKPVNAMTLVSELKLVVELRGSNV